MAVLLFLVALGLDIDDGDVFASFSWLFGMVGGLLGTGFGGFIGLSSPRATVTAAAGGVRGRLTLPVHPGRHRPQLCRDPS